MRVVAEANSCGEGWRRRLEQVEAAVSAIAEEGEAAERSNAGVDEAVAAVRELRRALEGDERAAGSGMRDLGRLEVLGHLAAGVAHEFNNLLFVIRGFAELARMDLPDGDPITTNLNRIEEAVDRAEGLTRMVLVTARPSDGGPAAIQLYPLVKEGIKVIRESFTDDVRVHQDIATDAGGVAINAVQAYRVIMTLLENAATALGEEGGFLSVTLAETESEASTGGSSLLLTVAYATGEDGEEAWNRLIEQGGEQASLPPEKEGVPQSVRDIVEGLGGVVRSRSLDDRVRSFEVVLPLSPKPAVR